MDPVPPYVEAAIYLYFAVVATVGCLLHVRLRRRSRHASVDRADESLEAN